MTDDLVALRCLAEADPAAISVSAYRGGLFQAIDRIAELEKRAEAWRMQSFNETLKTAEQYERAEKAEARIVRLEAECVAHGELNLTNVKRAVKAEADLAAARDCIRDLAGPLTDFVGDFRHIDAIAAARGEHPCGDVGPTQNEGPGPVKSCETCHWWPDMPRSSACMRCVEFSLWKKPKSDVCPTCKGGGKVFFWDRPGSGDCPDCGGTGEKET